MIKKSNILTNYNFTPFISGLLFFMAVFVFAKADGYKQIIPFDKLPLTARNFINQHFGGNKPIYIEIERGVLSAEYEVKFADLSEIEFDGRGNWKSVKSFQRPVKAAIVPQQIRNWLSSNAQFSGCFITKIRRKPYKWEIDLSNGLEIEFNNSFQVIDIDD